MQACLQIAIDDNSVIWRTPYSEKRPAGAVRTAARQTDGWKTQCGGIDIAIYTQDFENEFISLTDIARYKSDDPTAVIQNWMRNRDVIEFLGLWEKLHNPSFNPLEFEGVKKKAGANAFTMSPPKRPIKKAPYKPEASTHLYPFAYLPYRQDISLLCVRNIFQRTYPETHVFYILMILLQSGISYYFLPV